ncbi:hypothetical protein [Streptomyces sp. NRRL F-5650]|uniref:hypothetical protein n=1 Tax=Streptomyces sp. NRRL F-5650 TaxID=1463868 RepID=UPI00131E26C2|nr:hypothetical protein [Streptomyces sp. NRRL F-5650]
MDLEEREPGKRTALRRRTQDLTDGRRATGQLEVRNTPVPARNGGNGTSGGHGPGCRGGVVPGDREEGQQRLRITADVVAVQSEGAVDCAEFLQRAQHLLTRGQERNVPLSNQLGPSLREQWRSSYA